MLGLLINEMETKELEYVLKREMEEIMLDLTDSRIDDVVKETMKDRYQVFFNLFRRVANEKDCLQYMLKTNTTKQEKHLNLFKS
ncbi:hypothetical protein AB4Y30_01355 [Ornithinibacillus sp. 4-3]|uniref:Uncharacterized protein n=1 Tax=Ornithinibacillus sp. 4-3 TaxID=3231488 RepID=A0AB39HRF0_9BACI